MFERIKCGHTNQRCLITAGLHKIICELYGAFFYRIRKDSPKFLQTFFEIFPIFVFFFWIFQYFLLFLKIFQNFEILQFEIFVFDIFRDLFWNFSKFSEYSKFFCGFSPIFGIFDNLPEFRNVRGYFSIFWKFGLKIFQKKSYIIFYRTLQNLDTSPSLKVGITEKCEISEKQIFSRNQARSFSSIFSSIMTNSVADCFVYFLRYFFGLFWWVCFAGRWELLQSTFVQLY